MLHVEGYLTKCYSITLNYTLDSDICLGYSKKADRPPLLNKQATLFLHYSSCLTSLSLRQSRHLSILIMPK